MAVLQKKIDRNNNALNYLWSPDGHRLDKIQGPVASQYLKLSSSKGLPRDWSEWPITRGAAWSINTRNGPIPIVTMALTGYSRE